MKKSLKDRITEQAHANLIGVTAPDKSNSGKYLWPILYWQVLSDVAEKAFKESWELAVRAGVLQSDEKLRALGQGEHLLIDSDRFSALVSVSKPRMNFNRELFIKEVSKKFKVSEDKLLVLAEACKEEGNPSLTKRVVEAAS